MVVQKLLEQKKTPEYQQLEKNLRDIELESVNNIILLIKEIQDKEKGIKAFLEEFVKKVEVEFSKDKSGKCALKCNGLGEMALKQTRDKTKNLLDHKRSMK